MCGIAGFALAAGEQPQDRAEALLERLSRRGPDGSWVTSRGGHCLVQTRLAIIDLDPSVTYPMSNEDGSVWLLFNGEVYDHAILRAELERHGHRFATRCDAEVVVHAWEQWGTDCFARLHGMFALAIADERTGDLVLARDRFGIKPLVRTTGARLAFSSDALALVAAGLSAGRVDGVAVREHLALHLVGAPLTGVEDLVDVAPGSWVRRRRDGGEEAGTYASVDPGGPAPREPVDLRDLDEALRVAVRRQLVADVPVGIFLSSGIDSSLVLSYAAELGAAPTAFTVGFAGMGDYDERAAAAALAARLGVAHEYADLEVRFADAVELHAGAFDRPFADSSSIATLRLARLARGGVTVALSGTGGDELFAGYHRHRAHRLRRVARLAPDRLTTWLTRRATRAGSRRSAVSLFAGYAQRLAAAGVGSDAAQYLALLTAGEADVLSATIHAPVDIHRTAERFARRTGLGRRPGSTPARDFAGHDSRSYLPADLLVKEDRSTMAYGLEVRVPLLDDAVLEVALRMPDHQKHGLRAGKLPLREIAARRLPGDVHRGRKRGFAVPLAPLLGGGWGADARAWLHDVPSEWVDGPRAAALLDRAPIPAAGAWSLIALVAWEHALAGARARASRLVAGSGLAR
jgi:asparagine synthase (glutamine-hydrolysing)